MGDLQPISMNQKHSTYQGSLAGADTVANRGELGDELADSQKYASDDEVENSRFNPKTIKNDKMQKHKEEMKMH